MTITYKFSHISEVDNDSEGLTCVPGGMIVFRIADIGNSCIVASVDVRSCSIIGAERSSCFLLVCLRQSLL